MAFLQVKRFNLVKDKFLLVDGNSLAYRAYYAMPFLRSPDGTNTGAIFGFLNMFLKALKAYNPTYVGVAFDFSKHTFRTELFPEYKGTRRETPEELREQFPLLRKILQMMRIPIVQQEGIEADDILGTLSKIKEVDTLILSADKDLLQLIDNSTTILLTKKGTSEIYAVDENVLKSEFGLSPSQIVDLKSLMGDKSDNIPGVPGVGEKTAKNLINKFGSLAGVYANLDSSDISAGIRAKLVEHKNMAELSYKLATIKTDCNIDINLEDYRLIYPFDPEVREMFRTYAFVSLSNKNIFSETSSMVQNFEASEHEIKAYDEIDEAVKNCNEFAFNFSESFQFATGSDVFYTISKEISFFSPCLEPDEVLRRLKCVLEDEKITKITVDLKSHLHLFDRLGIDVKGGIYDLKLGAYLIGGSKNITTKASSYFGLKKDMQEKLLELKLDNLYSSIELPLEYVLFNMEKAGFKMNASELQTMSKELSERLENLKNEIINLAGEDFNLNSPKKMAYILFDKLGLNIASNKKQSTGIEVLSQIASEHPIVPCIIEFRKIQKLVNSYLEPYQEIISKNGDIIHTIFNQTLTSTGRLSSSEPNLQNIPVRDNEGKNLRKLFVSRFDGGHLMSADYNQIELRLLAHYSQDDKLVNAFREGRDVHRSTAMDVFGLTEDEVTPSIRRMAKAVNFGIIYGISDYGLSQNAGLSRKEAKLYLEKYFETYPKVKQYMDESVEKARNLGYSETIMGRKRKIPEINSSNYQTRLFGERVALNMPLQGSASDIIKMAMIKVFDCLKDLKSELILQIHDELIVDVYPGEEEKVENILKTCMENVVQLSVPLPVEVSMGKTWFECK